MLGLPVLVPLERGGSDAAADLAEGFGSLLQQMHLQHTGDSRQAATIGSIGRALSELASDGHACLPLKDAHRYIEGLAGGLADLETLLRASPVIGLASSQRMTAPEVSVILDRDRLYLQRYWRYEARLAEQIGAIDAHLPLAPSERMQQVLDQLFHDTGTLDWQKVAAATALLRRLCLITGGPGTGKTHTIARLLIGYTMLAPGQRIALAAPTGKAALRLEQLIKTQLADLERSLIDQEPALLRVRELKAQTVHRLLGVRSKSTQFHHHKDRPLPYDLVVVDEASMLDLALASRLVDALHDNGRLILVGDADQLSSVETGTVFSELVSLANRDARFAADLARVSNVPSGSLEVSTDLPAPVGNAVVRLKHSFRYLPDGGIGTLADAVRRGNVARVSEILDHPPPELRFEQLSPNVDPAALAERLFTAFEPLMRLVELAEAPSTVLDSLGQSGILCALRRGPLGAVRLNVELTRLAAARQAANSENGWFAGRTVMVTRNDPQLKLYNGDLGIALKTDSGLLVHFADGVAGRAIAPTRLGPIDTAFAVTIHKSQGSEFEHVDIILPQPSSPLATRELLYTALTRARRSVTLWGDANTVLAATARATRRYSALAERLSSGSWPVLPDG